MGKVDRMPEKMGNKNRDGNSEKNQREMLEIKKTMRNEECL